MSDARETKEATDSLNVLFDYVAYWGDSKGDGKGDGALALDALAYLRGFVEMPDRRDADLERLTSALAEKEAENTKQAIELRGRRSWMDRSPFCPDHRDKVSGKECRECEIERLTLVLTAQGERLKAAEAVLVEHYYLKSYDGRWYEASGENIFEGNKHFAAIAAAHASVGAQRKEEGT